MSYVLTTEPKAHYLHLKVTGTVSRESVAGYMGEGIAKCAELGCTAALIEDGLTGPMLDLGTLFEIVSKASTAARPAVQAVAYVNTIPDHDRDLLRFAEHVAVNRALNVRLFRSVEEADKWLTFQAQRETSQPT